MKHTAGCRAPCCEGSQSQRAQLVERALGNWLQRSPLLPFLRLPTPAAGVAVQPCYMRMWACILRNMSQEGFSEVYMQVQGQAERCQERYVVHRDCRPPW